MCRATPWSTPTGAMRRNCPPSYLVDELRLLEPGVVVVVGRWVGDALASHLVVERSEQRPGLWRGTGTTGGRAIEILLQPSLLRPLEARNRLAQ